MALAVDHWQKQLNKTVWVEYSAIDMARIVILLDA